MTGTLMLDADGDLLLGDYESGTETIIVAVGADTVAQNMGVAVSLKKTTVWFNLEAGIDYDSLFYNSGKSDFEMEPIRSTAIREAIKSVPGFLMFRGSEKIKFTREGRTLIPDITCVEIDCDNQITQTFVESIA